ncbi:hypothetical protein [Haladaptatus salinisoli]|uniref:hypothetical protein n=1 Tax=Haladaptatus salinisoli TaxID=2884876 RepID=UPI001D09DF30|nr:hypothetical protein [Haladaptatus salinisoli]
MRLGTALKLFFARFFATFLVSLGVSVPRLTALALAALALVVFVALAYTAAKRPEDTDAPERIGRS